jgi:hypothetical protein
MLQTICDNKTQIVYIGECKIKSIVVYSDGADGDVTIYNGSSLKEVLKLKVGSVSNTSVLGNFGDGIVCDRGVYVVVNADTTYYTIILAAKDE